MAIGKKVKKKSEDTIDTTKRVISTNVKSVQRQKANGTYNTGRQNVGASLRSNGEAQADWGSKVRAPKAYDTKTLRQRASYSSAVAAKNKEDSKPKSFSGSAMKVRASYRNAVRSKTDRSNYRSPEKIASEASHSTRADIYNRALTGDSYGKRKQDFKKVNTEKSTAHNMKRKTIRDVSDFDLQMGDWGRAGARHESTMGADMRWVGREAKWNSEKKRKKRK